LYFAKEGVTTVVKKKRQRAINKDAGPAAEAATETILSRKRKFPKQVKDLFEVNQDNWSGVQYELFQASFQSESTASTSHESPNKLPALGLGSFPRSTMTMNASVSKSPLVRKKDPILKSTEKSDGRQLLLNKPPLPPDAERKM
jgi:hypothetical protein